MTENDRVKALRLAKGLTMERFGEKLGVQKSAISKIEHGENNVSDQMRNSICREFNVSEEWLKDGSGEMIKRGYSEEIAALAQAYGLDEADQAVIVEYARLSPEERRIVKEYISRTYHAIRSTGNESFPDGIDTEVEDYRRQLLMEKKAEEGSEALPTESA